MDRCVRCVVLFGPSLTRQSPSLKRGKDEVQEEWGEGHENMCGVVRPKDYSQETGEDANFLSKTNT